jgi:hypothetical protein
MAKINHARFATGVRHREEKRSIRHVLGTDREMGASEMVSTGTEERRASPPARDARFRGKWRARAGFWVRSNPAASRKEQKGKEAYLFCVLD